jgi:hypothetical protein
MVTVALKLKMILVAGVSVHPTLAPARELPALRAFSDLAIPT